MSSEDNDFEKGDSGASTTELAEAGRMKPGSLIMMKEQYPCKVTAFSTAKPGKHGSAKAMITAKDIFTDKQYDETFGTGDMIPRPIVKKFEWTCTDISDDVPTLLTPEFEEKQDLNLPTEAHLQEVVQRMRAIIEAGTHECLVTFQKWGDREQIIGVREGNSIE